MKEGNGFRFDQRISVLKPPEGQTVVKFYGLPVFVSKPCDGDTFVGNSGITEGQLRELNGIFAEVGIAGLVEQKQSVAKGLDAIGERLHNDPERIELAFTASKELKRAVPTLSRGYEHVTGCEHCQAILQERISDY